MDVLLGVAPLAAALACLLVLRRTALISGLAGSVVALIVALMQPRFGLERLPVVGARALLLTWVVAYVLLFGLLLYQLMAAGGAIARIGASLAALPGDRPATALLLTLPLGAFVEAVSGFGVSIVVVAPLLVVIGFAPRRAALLALFTQNAVPWGALAIGVVLSGELSGLPVEAIGLGCALLSAPLFPYFAGLLLWMAGGRAAVLRHVPLLLGVGAAMAAGAVLATLAFGVELGMVVAGPVVLLLGLAWLRRTGVTADASPSDQGLGEVGRSGADAGRELAADADSDARAGSDGGDRGAIPTLAAGQPSLGQALAPYGVLVAALLASRLVAPLRIWLQTHLVLDLPSFGVTLPLLYSPGFPLALVCLAVVPLLGLSVGDASAAAVRTVRQWLRASAALMAFMLLSELMLQSGMTDRLAGATADALGYGYVAAGPALAALSGFMTGSNAAGSAMLLPFQLRVAASLGVPGLVFAASQNAAAAAASLASPQRVVLAATVMGVPEAESELIRSALLIELGVVVLIALAQLAWLATLPR